MLAELLRKLRHSSWPREWSNLREWFHVMVEAKKGDKFPIRYNPAHPERNGAEPYGDWEK
jgi:hypothetical protein